jgi:hypothetical protein
MSVMYKDLHYVIPSGYNVDFENYTKTMNSPCGQNYLLPTGEKKRQRSPGTGLDRPRNFRIPNFK